MIRLRRATALDVRPRRPGLAEVDVEVDGTPGVALAYEPLCGVVPKGSTVVLNTTAVALGLGTGGVHFVIAVEGGEPLDAPGEGHAIKLRYTPLQVKVSAVEEERRDAVDAVESLNGMPVLVAGLHSALAPACIGVRSAAPSARIAYVMTDGAALPLAFSETVPALRDAGLIDTTITCGQAFGGEYEAVTLFGALAAAASVAAADIVVVAMGPGHLGTGSRWGFALTEAGVAVNAVAAMEGRPVVSPRVSFADPRGRHRGVSHHSLTALGRIALAPADVAIAPMADERIAFVRAQLGAPGIRGRHRIVETPLGDAEEALRSSPVRLASMGRGFDEDPDYFRCAAAGGVHAASLIRGAAQ